jgi:two-component system nitrate/nitrite sensor histidine kinase NarX
VLLADQSVIFFALLGGLFLLIATLVIVWRWALSRKEKLQQELIATRAELERESQYTDAVVALSQLLLEASDEASIIHVSMQAASIFLNSQGCSFVPFDEWRRSFSPLTYGLTPKIQSETWQDRLTTPETRQVCKLCQERQGAERCVLLTDIDGPQNVFCVALCFNGREIGVINFYFDKPLDLNQVAHRFLGEMVRSVDLALEAMHSRQQELDILRYLQTTDTSREMLLELLSNLLENIQHALGVDFVSVWVPDNVTFKAPLWLHYPQATSEFQSAFNPTYTDDLWQTVSLSRQTLTLENVNLQGSTQVENWRTLLIVPLVWQDEAPAGMLVLGNHKTYAFEKHQLLLLQTVAGQAALMIQNSQRVVEISYQAILDERRRLAREIHDGLAQTLAFLKLEAGRMQNYIVQGQMERVNQTLRGCYQTLSDAYLDARQAIDDLRRIPDVRLPEWLKATARDFEELVNIPVHVDADSLSHDFSPAIQAQLVRIFQEALTNVRKHAQARHVILRVQQVQDLVTIEVRDDGVGFAPEDAPVITQHGLRGMRERAEMIGADFQIISRVGEGSTIRLEVPIRLEEGV